MPNDSIPIVDNIAINFISNHWREIFFAILFAWIFAWVFEKGREKNNRLKKRESSIYKQAKTWIKNILSDKPVPLGYREIERSIKSNFQI
jgi:hypothetical protein